MTKNDCIDELIAMDIRDLRIPDGMTSRGLAEYKLSIRSMYDSKSAEALHNLIEAKRYTRRLLRSQPH